MSFSDIWAGMLNNRAKRGSEQVLEHIGITEGDVIADIGSGGVFFLPLRWQPVPARQAEFSQWIRTKHC